MLGGFGYDVEIPTEVLSVLERSVSLSVELLQIMFDLVMSPFPRQEVINEKKDRNL